MMNYTKKEQIESDLANQNKRYYIVDTYLEQDAIRWRRGYKRRFQKELCNMGLEYFAYIKFFLQNNDKIAIVVGKSGSLNVNKSQGCDLNFSEYPSKGKARKWLFDNHKEWCKTEILIIPAQTQSEAYDIEKGLLNGYGLYES